ncbi:protein YgfX [Microbulbifer sp.]|uniref:protein YgfX n=1 Tax=Microbulbifer sp. TaxID=1908541 RepID=UPI003F3A94E9
MTTPDYSSSYPAYLERSARLTCAVAPSRFLFALLLLIAAQALLLLWWCRLPWFLLLPAALLVLVYTAFEWRRLRRVRGLLSTRERRWFWRRAGGVEREFEFSGELVLWSWLVVINGCDLRGRRLRLVLARDSMDGGDWRRLQVALRYSR